MLNTGFEDGVVSLHDIRHTSDEKMMKALEYLKFAASPHPEKGAPGAVCPFLPAAIKNNMIYFYIIDEEITEEAQLKEIVEDSIEKFKNIKVEKKQLEKYKSLLIVFTNYTTEETLLKRVHKAFKLELIHDGIMVGEFYPTNFKSGLYNKDFKPLVSKVPMMAIRNLIKEDFPFLINKQDSTDEKLEFLKGYNDSLKDVLCQKQKDKVKNEMLQLKRM